MKVRMKKYPTWWGPYQVAEKLYFWGTEDQKFSFGDKFAHNWIGNAISKVANMWVNFHEKRRIQVRIDRWDTWSFDTTLAHIILPGLRQLAASKHGAPFVDDEDVPEELRSTAAEPTKSDFELDEFFFARWDWVLNEMIWAFEELIQDQDYPDAGLQKLRNERLRRGFRLFGKYYTDLWD